MPRTCRKALEERARAWPKQPCQMMQRSVLSYRPPFSTGQQEHLPSAFIASDSTTSSAFDDISKIGMKAHLVPGQMRQCLVSVFPFLALPP